MQITNNKVIFMQIDNPFLRAETSLITLQEAGKDKSYWARIVKRDASIEYRYLKKETKDLKKLREACVKGDVQHVIFWGEQEIQNTRIILDSLFEQVKSALIMAHIQKENLHHLLQEDDVIGGRNLPTNALDHIKDTVLQEINDVDERLRKLGAVLTGESCRD